MNTLQPSYAAWPSATAAAEPAGWRTAAEGHGLAHEALSAEVESQARGLDVAAHAERVLQYLLEPPADRA